MLHTMMIALVAMLSSSVSAWNYGYYDSYYYSYGYYDSYYRPTPQVQYTGYALGINSDGQQTQMPVS